jgi:hypothetical protein
MDECVGPARPENEEKPSSRWNRTTTPSVSKACQCTRCRFIGALQVWRNYLRDPQGTIQQYRQALSRGATRSLPELYTAAGAKFAFDVTLLQDMVRLVTGKIEALEQEV